MAVAMVSGSNPALYTKAGLDFCMVHRSCSPERPESIYRQGSAHSCRGSIVGLYGKKPSGLGQRVDRRMQKASPAVLLWSLMWKYTSTLRSQNPPDLCFMLRRSCASRSRTGDERDSLFAAGAFIRPCARAGPFGAAARLAGAFTREARRVRRQQRHR